MNIIGYIAAAFLLAFIFYAAFQLVFLPGYRLIRKGSR